MRFFDKLNGFLLKAVYRRPYWLSKNAQGAGGSSPCRVWAEPTFLVPQHFQESTASTEGAIFAALTDKNEVFPQAEWPSVKGSLQKAI